ncbi:MAG: enolase C-terminal domain-like protein, partial [Ideonella sp.]
MSHAPKLVVTALDARVRPVQLRLPFRFGAITLTACPQLFVRVSLDDGTEGFAAEMMVPKWFDKRAALTPRDNVEHLAQAIEMTAAAYVGDAPATAFGLYWRHRQALASAAEDAGLTGLSGSFGQAVIDRAVLDAMCRAHGVSFFEAARDNLIGIDAVDALPGWDWSAWLASLQPLKQIEARHTVGMLDELDTVRHGDDGLPISLRAVIRRYGQRSFKIKLGGDPRTDLSRLRAVLAVLDSELGDFRYTLDGNEQYADATALDELLDGLAPLQRPLYIEQPVPRELSFATALPADRIAPFLMDEAD